MENDSQNIVQTIENCNTIGGDNEVDVDNQGEIDNLNEFEYDLKNIGGKRNISSNSMSWSRNESKSKRVLRNLWVIDEKKKQVLIIYYMTH